jgi:nucleoside-diphosphate-sugar epimerase/predicted dehydrogenase
MTGNCVQSAKGNSAPFDFRVGLVGCGRIASAQIKYIQKYVPADKIALCDVNPHRMNWLSESFGLFHKYDQLSALLLDFTPDILHILTPPHTHKEIAVYAMKMGAHPFIEKPMGLTTQECSEIIETASQEKKSPCVDLFMPFDPLLVRARQLIERDRLGQLVHCSISDFRNYLERKKTGLSPAWLRNLPGELLFDIIPHHLSILNTFLPNAQLHEVCCQRDHGEIAQMICLFDSPSGKGLINIRLDAAYNRPYHILLEGTRGLIEIDFESYDLVFRRKNHFHGLLDEAYQQTVSARSLLTGIIRSANRFLLGFETDTGMDRLIELYYRALADKRSAPVPTRQGHKITAQVSEIFRNAGIAFEKIHIPATNRIRVSKEKADILVTGGTGFIGRALVAKLQQSGYTVRILYRPRPPGENRKMLFDGSVHVLEGDISDRSMVERACRDVKLIYHLAAATSGDLMNHIDASILGTQNIMEAMENTGCDRLVYVSTIALLNRNRFPQNGLVDEMFSYEEYPHKRDPYCYAKLIAEKIVRSHVKPASPKNIVILRPGLVYGPGKIPVFNQAKRLGPFHVFKGSGERLLPLVYIDNLVDALLLSAEAPQSGIFNVIDDDAVTVKRFIRTYESMTGFRFQALYIPIHFFMFMFLPLEILFKFTKKKTPPLNYPIKGLSRSVKHSNDRLKKELDWRPAVNFQEGLQRSIGGAV